MSIIKYWPDIEEAVEQTECSWDHCLLDLRDRLETVESSLRQARIDILKLSNACARFAPDRDKFFADLIPDEDGPDKVKPTIREELMTNQQHPITPPEELVEDWLCNPDPDYSIRGVIKKAAQWGADQELEACCDWLHWQNLATHQDLIPSLRAGRRPKVPSLKERALEAMHRNWNPHNNDDFATIARALEQLDD